MRFHLGPVPEDVTFDPEAEGWLSLREPTSGRMMLLAVLLGIAMAVVVAWVWLLVLPVSESGQSGAGFSITITPTGLLGAVVLLLGFVLLHEFLHAVPALVAGRWNDLVLGFWPRYCAPYVALNGALPRNAHLVSGLLPFLVLTLLPLLTAAALDVATPWLAILSALNAAASGADLIALVLYSSEYGMSMIENLERIRELGVDGFVAFEKVRWGCTECGGVICVHRTECIYCGHARRY